MKALSEQLSELSTRSKKTEDLIAATMQQDRAKLETQRATLRSLVTTGVVAANDRASAAKNVASTEWADARTSVRRRFETIRANADARRVETGAERAEHHAQAAELDAVDAIEFALYVMDQAQYAVVDAAIARADADDVAAKK
jgi:hypothetical protein